jgi:hypothetical protein
MSGFADLPPPKWLAPKVRRLKAGGLAHGWLVWRRGESGRPEFFGLLASKEDAEAEIASWRSDFPTKDAPWQVTPLFLLGQEWVQRIAKLAQLKPPAAAEALV